MSKPDWKDAPEWARYVAQDADKSWFWHQKEPRLRARDWASDGRILGCGKPDPDESWMDTLERRP